ncbi:hypothetical protein ACIPJS_39590 [Streptomyces sp. NPDC086783]|uniref:hypothetical protein n=1 Tax=Streptomyces sp. NPDC086783 TaxID=3365758 RepID=UPI00382AD597
MAPSGWFYDAFAALDEQSGVGLGTSTLDVPLLSLAKSLADVHEHRRALEFRHEARRFSRA